MWLWFLILPYALTIFRHVLIKFPGFLLTQAVCSFPQRSGSQWPVVSSYTALDMAGPAGHGNTALLLSTQQRALYKKNHGSAMRNLSLWIGSCVHCIRAWFSVGIPSTKPLTVWKTPGCVVAVERSRTDWEGNTAWFVQQRAAAQNISLWFRVTKGNCLLLSSSALSGIGLLVLSWLATECTVFSCACSA